MITLWYPFCSIKPLHSRCWLNLNSQLVDALYMWWIMIELEHKAEVRYWERNFWYKIFDVVIQ